MPDLAFRVKIKSPRSQLAQTQGLRQREIYFQVSCYDGVTHNNYRAVNRHYKTKCDFSGNMRLNVTINIICRLACHCKKSRQVGFLVLSCLLVAPGWGNFLPLQE